MDEKYANREYFMSSERQMIPYSLLTCINITFSDDLTAKDNKVVSMLIIIIGYLTDLSKNKLLSVLFKNLQKSAKYWKSETESRSKKMKGVLEVAIFCRGIRSASIY